MSHAGRVNDIIDFPTDMYTA